MSELPKIVRYIEAVFCERGRHRTANDVVSYAREFLEGKRDEADDEETQSPIGICENCRWWVMEAHNTDLGEERIGICRLNPCAIETERRDFCSHWTAKGRKP